MKTIALINQKGGVGKTTVAIHLATAYTRAGKNVVLLDLDPQASAAEWKDAREGEFPHVESIQPARLEKKIEQFREIGADIMILDTAPHSEGTALDAAKRADLVIVPCKPSIMDLRAMKKTIDLVKLVNAPAFALLNGVQHHSLQAAEDAAITITMHLGMPVSTVVLGERVAFNRCLITGQSAQEIDPGGKASKEIDELLKWTTAQLEKRKAAA